MYTVPANTSWGPLMTDRLVDRQRSCTDCGRPFTWTAAAQQQQQVNAAQQPERTWRPPSRCRYCRRQYRLWLAHESQRLKDANGG